MITGFLLGVIVTASITAGAYFFKFWKQTREPLFLAFAIAFLTEGFNRTSFLFIETPNEGSPAIYIVRLIAFLLILGAIVKKNQKRQV